MHILILYTATCNYLKFHQHHFIRLQELHLQEILTDKQTPKTKLKVDTSFIKYRPVNITPLQFGLKSFILATLCLFLDTKAFKTSCENHWVWTLLFKG